MAENPKVRFIKTSDEIYNANIESIDDYAFYKTEDKVFLGKKELSNEVTGVKGSNETLFRVGEVTITKDNIGLGKADNTPDAEKAVLSATKLATIRTILTDLASNTAADFDGTKNVTPGVKGVLGLANGGTGNITGTAQYVTSHDILEGTDLNNLTDSGFYVTADAGLAAKLVNCPVPNGSIALCTIKRGPVNSAQILVSQASAANVRLFVRTCYQDEWGEWIQVYTPNNPQKDIAGNAATATKLTSSAGSETQPVYFKDGKPVVTAHALEPVTTTKEGLMSAADKVKLDGIDTNANKYTLPVASATVLGGIKSGTDISVDASGNVSVVDDSHNHVIGNVDGLQAALDAKVPKTTTVNGKALSGNITLSYSDVQAIPASDKGAKGGVATLGTDGKVPSSQLPSYVDDVIEGYLNGGKFYKEDTHTTEIPGEAGKIYIDLHTSKTYRWSGTVFSVISETLALGTTSSTAFYGDKGQTAYEHATAKGTQLASGLWKVTTNAQGHVTAGTAVSKADITGLGIPGSDTTYGNAVANGAAGLMTGADKAKLDGIASGANAYSLPTASATVLGGVKTGFKTADKDYAVTIDASGNLHVNVPWTDNNTWVANSATAAGYVASGSGQANKVWKTDANGAPAWRDDADTKYTLPVATSGALGGVKSGGDITVATTGAVTVTHATSANTATSATSATNATNADTVDGYHAGFLPDYGCIPTIEINGVTEIGKYLDFHSVKGESVDHDVRITATKSGLTLSGTTSGTFSGNLTGKASTAGVADTLSSTLPVSKGGTGATTLAANSFLFGNGTSAITTSYFNHYRIELHLGTGPAAGWRRVCKLTTPTTGYIQCLLFEGGGWNDGSPTGATVAINIVHTTPYLKLLNCFAGSLVPKIRLTYTGTSATAEYYLDAYVNAQADSVSHQVFVLVGNVSVSEINTAHPAPVLTTTFTTARELTYENNTSQYNYASAVVDSQNGNKITMNYSASGLTTTSWLAAWNNYELRAIAPATVKSLMGLNNVSNTADADKSVKYATSAGSATSATTATTATTANKTKAALSWSGAASGSFDGSTAASFVIPTWSTLSGKPTLAAVATSGSYNDLTNKPNIPAAYSLPTASASTKGGVLLGYSASGKNYALQVDNNGKAFVNVPWTDTHTTYTAGLGVDLTDNKITVTGVRDSASASSEITMSYSEAAKSSASYAAVWDSHHIGNMAVDDLVACGIGGSSIGSASAPVYWNGSKFVQGNSIPSAYSLPTASSTVKGGVQLGYSASGKNYALQVDSSGKAYVYVPWSDTNTTYSAGAGLSLSGTTFNVTGVKASNSAQVFSFDDSLTPTSYIAYVAVCKNSDDTIAYTDKDYFLDWIGEFRDSYNEEYSRGGLVPYKLTQSANEYLGSDGSWHTLPSSDGGTTVKQNNAYLNSDYYISMLNNKKSGSVVDSLYVSDGYYFAFNPFTGLLSCRASSLGDQDDGDLSLYYWDHYTPSQSSLQYCYLGPTGSDIHACTKSMTKTFLGLSGADYAEYIKEWADGNPNNEDRVGYFVTLKNQKLYIAKPGDYIAGIITGNASLIGNDDNEEYSWKYKRDEFNRIIYEEVPEEKTIRDPKTHNAVKYENGDTAYELTGKMIKVEKYEEDYNANLEYIPRKDRPEWDAVGMKGVLPVRDDGTCIPDAFCKCGEGGIATFASERGFDTFYVIERINDHVVSVQI